MATDYETLIPSGIADEAIAAAEQESVVLALGNVIRIHNSADLDWLAAAVRMA